MDITKLSISKLKKESVYQVIDAKGDTLDIQIWKEHDKNLPLLEAEIRIKNISDTMVILYPNESKLCISYYFGGERFMENIYFYIKQEDNETFPTKEIVLNPNQEFYLLSSGYIADSTSLNLKFIKQNDNTINVMKILPTLKYRYKDERSGIEVVLQDILDVNICKLPIGSELMIPAGYHILE